MVKLSDLSELKSTIKSAQSKTERTECVRCGTCCAKGGPALHIEDLPLIEKGDLHGRFLFTIRQGEPAEDNVKGGIVFATSDIIKIKSRDAAEACLFADFQQNRCTIYESRPLECRILKCWDTREIEELYNKNYLTRKDVIGKINGLWEIVEEHQQTCSFEKIRQLIDESRGQIAGTTLEKLLEIVQYDISLRALVTEKTETDPNLLLFLFGQPLPSILRKLGIEFKQKTA